MAFVDEELANGRSEQVVVVSRTAERLRGRRTETSQVASPGSGKGVGAPEDPSGGDSISYRRLGQLARLAAAKKLEHGALLFRSEFRGCLFAGRGRREFAKRRVGARS